MNLYLQELLKEGFPDTRAYDIAMGINLLHKAICLLDNKNNSLFWQKTVELRLKEFTRVEGLNNHCLKEAGL